MPRQVCGLASPARRLAASLWTGMISNRLSLAESVIDHPCMLDGQQQSRMVRHGHQANELVSVCTALYAAMPSKHCLAGNSCAVKTI